MLAYLSAKIAYSSRERPALRAPEAIPIKVGGRPGLVRSRSEASLLSIAGAINFVGQALRLSWLRTRWRNGSQTEACVEANGIFPLSRECSKSSSMTFQGNCAAEAFPSASTRTINNL